MHVFNFHFCKICVDDNKKEARKSTILAKVKLKIVNFKNGVPKQFMKPDSGQSFFLFSFQIIDRWDLVIITYSEKCCNLQTRDLVS